MIFETLNNINQNENKHLDKHIKLNPSNAIKLNEVQIAFKTQTNKHINLNQLINMSVNVFIKNIKKEIVNNNELQAIEYIKNELKEINL